MPFFEADNLDAPYEGPLMRATLPTDADAVLASAVFIRGITLGTAKADFQRILEASAHA